MQDNAVRAMISGLKLALVGLLKPLFPEYYRSEQEGPEPGRKRQMQ
jgi:hypothetical protein